MRSLQMKAAKAWRLRIGDMQIFPGPRNRSPVKRPLWIIVLVSLVSMLLAFVYIYPLQSSAACYLFSSRGCKALSDWLPPVPPRELTDDEIASRVVIRDILNAPPTQSPNPKLAFMFLSLGSLPFEKLWDKFFHGHEGRFSVYVHASKEKPVHVSRHFFNRDIHSDQVVWGKMSMVDAEKRLLANALLDPDNQHFVLLSDSCVPLYNFDYVYNYLMHTNISYVDSFEDPGPHGNGRYSEHMLPEVEKKEFRKGAQVHRHEYYVEIGILFSLYKVYFSSGKLFRQTLDPVATMFENSSFLHTWRTMKINSGVSFIAFMHGGQ